MNGLRESLGSERGERTERAECPRLAANTFGNDKERPDVKSTLGTRQVADGWWEWPGCTVGWNQKRNH